jgi:pantothenate kinase
MLSQHARPAPARLPRRPAQRGYAGRVRCGAAVDASVELLAQRCLSALAAAPPDKRLLFGLAGCPGSGKSTLASALVQRLGPVAALLPMDGFHLSRAQLDALPNAAEAHARRGAPFTFDADAFVRTVRACVPSSSRVLAPSFDHAAGDPVADAVSVLPSHRLVVIEGNYLLLAESPWRELRLLFTECWFVDVSPATALRRIVRRHQAVWGMSEAEGLARATGNDLPNAELVWAGRAAASLMVPNEDES